MGKRERIDIPSTPTCTIIKTVYAAAAAAAATAAATAATAAAAGGIGLLLMRNLSIDSSSSSKSSRTVRTSSSRGSMSSSRMGPKSTGGAPSCICGCRRGGIWGHKEEGPPKGLVMLLMMG